MPKQKPLIGVTASVQQETHGPCTSPAYMEALADSGALPLLLPLTLTGEDCRQLADTLDGILFTGGPDVHPFYFGEETLEGCGNQSALRDSTELLLFSHVYARKKPILAICRGVQLLNIALGGDIYQDIASQARRSIPIAHSQPYSPSVPSHHVTVKQDSLLASITCRLPESCSTHQLEVNSAHHQAVRRPAGCLTVCAQAPDGIIEALEQPEYPFLLGIQWHPELLYHNHSHARQLFTAFTEAALKHSHNLPGS